MRDAEPLLRDAEPLLRDAGAGESGDKEPTVLQSLGGLLMLSAGFLWLFVAFNGAQNIETSAVPGPIGFWSLGALYFTFALAALFFAPAVVPRMRPQRLNLFIGSTGYVAFQVANIFPSWATLIPAGVVLGASASLLWAAQGKYVTDSAANYAAAKSLPAGTAMGLFNGIFFAIFQCTQVFGNVLLSTILLEQSKDSGSSASKKSQVMFFIFLGIAGVGSLILGLLPSQETRVTRELAEAKHGKAGTLPVSQLVLAVVRLLQDRRMLLLLPTLFYSGFEQGHLFGSITSGVIKPALGKEYIGWVVAVFGAVDAVSSYLWGIVCDRYRWGKRFVVAVGFVVGLLFWGFYFYLVTFVPNWETWLADRPSVLFVSMGLYGLSDAMWNVFPGTMLSTMFADNSEAAFSNLKVWQSIAFAISLAWGPYVSLSVKFATLIGTLVVATASIVALDRVAFSLVAPARTLEEPGFIQ